MSRIEIPNSKLFIEIDERQYILKESIIPEKGKPYDKVYGYYGDLSYLLSRVVHIEVSQQALVYQLKEYLDIYNSRLKELIEACTVGGD